MPRSLSLSLVCIAAAFQPAGPQPRADAPPPSINDAARALPPLAKEGGVVAIPLAHQEPWAWRPVRKGVSIASAKDGEDPRPKLTISYTRDPGQASGAAILVPPGSLTGLTAFRVGIASVPQQRLLVSLTDEAGVIWSFPAFKARADAANVELKVSAIAPDRYQNKVANPGPFDASKVVMITVLDINGFMGGASVPCTIAVGPFNGVCP